jgi:hypothetical protein
MDLAEDFVKHTKELEAQGAEHLRNELSSA